MVSSYISNNLWLALEKWKLSEQFFSVLTSDQGICFCFYQARCSRVSDPFQIFHQTETTTSLSHQMINISHLSEWSHISPTPQIAESYWHFMGWCYQQNYLNWWVFFGPSVLTGTQGSRALFQSPPSSTNLHSSIPVLQRPTELPQKSNNVKALRPLSNVYSEKKSNIPSYHTSIPHHTIIPSPVIQIWARVDQLLVLGMVIQPLIGNPYNGYINPCYSVDDHPLLYGNNGSLDPSTYENDKFLFLTTFLWSPDKRAVHCHLSFHFGEQTTNNSVTAFWLT